MWTAPFEDVRPLLTAERADLLEFLAALSPEEWPADTAAPGWTVKDLALNVLDDDLGWLSRLRDRDLSGVVNVSDSTSFVSALAMKNQRWIDGAGQLSLPVVAGLLGWSGREMDDWYATLDLMGKGGVYWASDGPVPLWFELAQDLTERWVHQGQMREAVDRLGTYGTDYLRTVLRTLVWAFPHQYRVSSAPETEVAVSLAGGGQWTLVSDGQGRWEMHEGEASLAAASLLATHGAGWRLLTGARFPEDAVTVDGPHEMTEPLRLVRGIIF